MQRTIQIELNELCPGLIDEFIADGQLPNFRRLRESSEVFITDASDEANLEPWVQWPTLHSGVPDLDHGIEHLGEGHRLSGRGIARELAAAGFRVGVFGSMNLDYGPLDGFVLPDPWNPKSKPHPAALTPFTNFVSSAVQENSANKIDLQAALPFLKYLTTHGLAATTVLSALRQVIQERRDGGIKWRRPFILDAISYDAFRNLVRRHEVAYATFFSNSTAHLQHYYWRNFRPESFTIPSPPEDHPSLTDAILAGYQNHDRLLGRFLADFPDDRLILVTALSQEPWDTTMCTYRPKDFNRLLGLVGIDGGQVIVEPVMAERFFLSFPHEMAARNAAARLTGTQIGDKALFYTEQTEPLRLKVGCAVNDWTLDRRIVTMPDGNQVPFDDLFLRIHSLRSGRHNPDGCFWVRSTHPRRIDEKIPLTSVAPTILRLFDVDAPCYMKEPAVELAELAVSQNR